MITKTSNLVTKPSIVTSITQFHEFLLVFNLAGDIVFQYIVVHVLYVHINERDFYFRNQAVELYLCRLMT